MVRAVTSPDAPIPAGTLCTLSGSDGLHLVRAYATIWPGVLWDGTYRCIDRDRRWSRITTREQLRVIGGGQ